MAGLAMVLDESFANFILKGETSTPRWLEIGKKNANVHYDLYRSKIRVLLRKFSSGVNDVEGAAVDGSFSIVACMPRDRLEAGGRE